MHRAFEIIYKKRRLLVAVFIITALGLSIIPYRGPFRHFLRSYFGDLLLVLGFYLLGRLFFSYQHKFKIFTAVILISFALEFHQLLAQPVADTFFKELFIGSSYDHLDLGMYLLGGLLGLMLDKLLFKDK